MKIGFVSYFNSREIRAWSGSIYFIRRELEKAGVEIVPIDNLGSFIDELYKIKSLYYRAIGKNHHRLRERKIMQRAAQKAAKLIESKKPDILLSMGSMEVSMLDVSVPITFWSDATFRLLVNYYPEYTNLSSKTLQEGEFLEKMSIGKAAKMFFASDWAARSAVVDYNASPDKVRIIPFGANLLHPPTENEIEKFIKEKNYETIELLFVGVAFERKGGVAAIEIARKLHSMGRRVRLHVVGCKPVIRDKPEFVKIWGFLRKDISQDLEIIEQLYQKAHFFVMPSIAECYGIVFCEANAYGLPVVAAYNGGMPAIVKENHNGWLLDYNNYENSINLIVSNILEIIENKVKYENLALKAYDEYRNRLNWGVSVRKLLEELNKI